MKKTKGLIVKLLSLIVLVSILSSPVYAAENQPGTELPLTMFLSAPDTVQRRFDVNDVFDLWKLSNFAYTNVICIGTFTKLEITLELNSELYYSEAYVDFGLFYTGLDITAFIPLNFSDAQSPFAIEETVSHGGLPLNGPIAVIPVFAYLKSISDDLAAIKKKYVYPMEFSITFNLE